MDILSTSSSTEPWSLAVLGDLHLAPEQMELFDAARSQLTAALASKGTWRGPALAQLPAAGCTLAPAHETATVCSPTCPHPQLNLQLLSPCGCRLGPFGPAG
jgi:hypothetical protein